MTARRLPLPVALLLGCWLPACRSGEPSPGGKAGAEEGADSGDDAGAGGGADTGPDSEVFTEVPVADAPSPDRLIQFSVGYSLWGPEGLGRDGSYVDDYYQGAGVSSGILVPSFDPTLGDRCYAFELSAGRTIPDVDLGARIEIFVGEDRLLARREVFDGGGVEYFGDRSPPRSSYTSGQPVTMLNQPAGTVPEAVQLTEPWRWEERRAELVEGARLRVSWVPGDDPANTVGLRFSFVGVPDAAGVLTEHYIACELVDDGGVVVTGVPNIVSADQYFGAVTVSRMLETWPEHPELGPVRFFVETETALDGDPGAPPISVRPPGSSPAPGPAPWPRRLPSRLR